MPVQHLQTQSQAHRFLDFPRTVYANNPFWIPYDPCRLLTLSRPLPDGLDMQLFWVTSLTSDVVATVATLISDDFDRHCNDHIGHLLFFEALPSYNDEVSALLHEACDYLRSKGCKSARASFLWGWQNPWTIDSYERSPTFLRTFNPSYYHNYIKAAGFSTERGFLEYATEFSTGLSQKYGEVIRNVSESGVDLRAWMVDSMQDDVALFTEVYNRTFADHWGAPLFSVTELSAISGGFEDFVAADMMGFASVEDEIVGTLFALPDFNQALRLVKASPFGYDGDSFTTCIKKIDRGLVMVVGVDRNHRNRGIGAALVAQSYLGMIARGYSGANYTIVLDDNWPSRSIAEGLGGSIERNYVCYGRRLTE